VTVDNKSIYPKSDIVLENGLKMSDIYCEAIRVLVNENTKIQNNKNKKEILKPFEIKKKLDEYVIGQEDAKITLAVSAYNHYKRINQTEGDVELQKSNVLLVGKSGSGKTLLVETLAKILDVPFVGVDATDFTPTGIVGRSTEDILIDLLNKSCGDHERAERGIVFIDEIDKIANTENNPSIIRKDGAIASEVQSCFLKLLEGKESSFNFKKDNFTFNTKNVLFICGGAFTGIENILDTSSFRKVGFNNTNDFEIKSPIKNKVKSTDIIKYGLMPELVGRIPVIVNLHSLSINDLIKILTEPKNALVKQYQKLFNMDNVELEFTKDALETIANIAISTETGARGLRTIIEDIITKAIYDVTLNESIKKCIITSNAILHKENPQMIFDKELAI
jgi:ATP-dependent Clp protease ATP-binding subunit ClpX